MRSPEREEQFVREYFEASMDEDVVHAEKVTSERVMENRHDVWDVHTDGDRYWVVTNPAKAYAQSDFKSMEVVLTFHVGLMARVMSRREPPVGQELLSRLAAPWRCWEQAADGLDQAEEAEEFQAVGMRCREALLAFARDASTDEMVPAGQEGPKAADFIHWSELIAGHVAAGGSAARLRSYLKSLARETWECVSWLTHARNATRFDAAMAIGAVEHVLSMFGMALLRFERGAPERCPECSSYRLTGDHRPDEDPARPYVTLCTECGWEGPRFAPEPVILAEPEDGGGPCTPSSDISTLIRLDDV